MDTEKTKKVTCKGCCETIPVEDMASYRGERLCDGCAQDAADYADYSDPLGMGYTNNPDYYG